MDSFACIFVSVTGGDAFCSGSLCGLIIELIFLDMLVGDNVCFGGYFDEFFGMMESILFEFMDFFEERRGVEYTVGSDDRGDMVKYTTWDEMCFVFDLIDVNRMSCIVSSCPSAYKLIVSGFGEIGGDFSFGFVSPI